MKTLVIIMSIICLDTMSNSVMARERYGHHDYHHGWNYGHNSYRHRGGGRYRQHQHSGYGIAYAIGGLIVGGIIGAALSQSSVSRSIHPDDQDLSYVPPKASQYAIKPAFIQQTDGSCHIISHVNNGSLVLSPVAKINCK